MFDMQLPDLGVVCGLDDAGLVDVMRDTARLESAITARKFAAAAELYQRRLAEQDADDREPLPCIRPAPRQRRARDSLRSSRR
jgi:hypothetical protein